MPTGYDTTGLFPYPRTRNQYLACFFCKVIISYSEFCRDEVGKDTISYIEDLTNFLGCSAIGDT